MLITGVTRECRGRRVNVLDRKGPCDPMGCYLDANNHEELVKVEDMAR